MKYRMIPAVLLCSLLLTGCRLDALLDFTEETESLEEEETSPPAVTRSAAEVNSIVDDLLDQFGDHSSRDISVQIPFDAAVNQADEEADTGDYSWGWTTGIHADFAILDCIQLETYSQPDPDSEEPICLPANSQEALGMTFPEQPVREIARGGFSFSDFAHRIVLPETITYFGNAAFKASSVTAFSHRAEEITMEEECFSQCQQLKTVNFYDNPVRLGDYCFSDSAITELTGEQCDLTTGRYCFMNLPELERVALEGDIQLGDYGFQHGTHPCTVTFSGGNIELGSYAFSDSGIETLEIGECQRAAIGESAFGKCRNLTAVTLEEGVAEIGSYVFMDCPQLAAVRLPESLKQIGADVFVNCSSDLVIEVPAGSYAETYCKEHELNYQTAD